MKNEFVNIEVCRLALDSSSTEEILLANGFVNNNNIEKKSYEPQHEITNNVACVTSKGSDQPALKRSLIRAFASRLNTL